MGKDMIGTMTNTLILPQYIKLETALGSYAFPTRTFRRTAWTVM
ncbi:hypothetical protein [Mediterraneibacter glycyrrhizinilyticus]